MNTYGSGYLDSVVTHRERYAGERTHLVTRVMAQPKRSAPPRRVRMLTPAGLFSARAAARDRDRDTCVLCGDPMWHVHHIIPITHGGTNDIDNLVCVCGSCHVALHGRAMGGLAAEGSKYRVHTRVSNVA